MINEANTQQVLSGLATLCNRVLAETLATCLRLLPRFDPDFAPITLSHVVTLAQKKSEKHQINLQYATFLLF
ncbi:hypothetical protein [Pseudophaeobacter sp.]|uniref:hypothetical protein n=1 Tax=Pseudophaeobacter sp. TaxID=1971739 RepID=UPI00329A04B6